MPVVQLACNAVGGEKSLARSHEDHSAAAGYASLDYFAMVHTPINTNVQGFENA